MKVARIDLRGLRDLGPAAAYARYARLVLSGRPGWEDPDWLREAVAQRGEGETFIAYSPVDAAPDWADWDYTYQGGHLEAWWTRAVNQNRLWLTNPGRPRPTRGAQPDILYWDRTLPRRYAVNLTDHRAPGIWAELVQRWHTMLEFAAGMRLGIFVDSTWAAHDLMGIYANADADRDGERDGPERVGLAWQHGLYALFSLLRYMLPGRPVLMNTKVPTYAHWGNVWRERAPLAPAALPEASAWAWPGEHFLQAGHDPEARLATLCLTLLWNNVYPAEDALWQKVETGTAEPGNGWIPQYDLELGVGARGLNNLPAVDVVDGELRRQYLDGKAVVCFNNITKRGRILL